MRDSRSLSILCAVSAIDMLGYGIVVPILPFFAEGLGASAIDKKPTPEQDVWIGTHCRGEVPLDLPPDC